MAQSQNGVIHILCIDIYIYIYLSICLLAGKPPWLRNFLAVEMPKFIDQIDILLTLWAWQRCWKAHHLHSKWWQTTTNLWQNQKRNTEQLGITCQKKQIWFEHNERIKNLTIRTFLKRIWQESGMRQVFNTLFLLSRKLWITWQAQRNSTISAGPEQSNQRSVLDFCRPRSHRLDVHRSWH